MSFSLLGGVAFNHMEGIGTSFHYRVQAAMAVVIGTFLTLFWVPSVEENRANSSMSSSVSTPSTSSEVEDETSSLQSKDAEKSDLNDSLDDDDDDDSARENEKSIIEKEDDDNDANNDDHNDNRGLAQLITLSTVLLVGSILVFGTLHGLWGGFYCLFLEKIIGSSQSQMGATFAVATFGETVAMFFSGYLHRKLGYQKCLALVYLAFTIR